MRNRLNHEQTAFIKYLTALGTEDNRGTLAVLRRGLMGDPVEDLNLYRFVARRVPEADRNTPRETVYYLTAALYALHPLNCEEGNLGSHLKQVAAKRDDLEAAERRFTALLNTRMEDLNTPLRQAVTLLKQQDLPVNWHALFADLLRWDHPQKMVQRAWANSFWAYERPAEAQAENQPADNIKEN